MRGDRHRRSRFSLLFLYFVFYIFIVRRDLFWGCFWSYWEITIFVGALLCRYTRILPPILLYFSSLILFRLVIYLFLLILCKFSFWYLDFIIIGKKCMNSVVYMNGNEYEMLLILKDYFLYINLFVIIIIISLLRGFSLIFYLFFVC